MSHSYEFHEAANVFPLMPESELRELADDIEENGQKEAVELFDGRIIDGRNRYLACKLKQIEPDVCEVEELDDPVQYVISRNLHRRQLKTSQRAVCAAKMAGLEPGRPKKETVQNCTVSDKAAALFRVGRTSVFHALAVLNGGCKHLIALCESGELSVSTASKFIDAVPKLPEQTKIAKHGAKAVREYMKPEPTEEPEPNTIVVLPENPTAEDISAVEIWLEQQDERSFVERFRSLFTAADDTGKAAMRAMLLDETR